MLLEGGFDFRRTIFYPVSGLQGNLLRVPTLGVSFGLSSIAELQIDGGLYNRLHVTARRRRRRSSAMLDFTGDNTTDVEDIVVATKVRVLSETPGRPAFGLRFATKLPNASNESGLGLDTTDFYASLLIGKTVQSVRMVGNAGLGILGDPTRGDRQNDVLAYGFSVARAVRQGSRWSARSTAGYQPADDAGTPAGTDSRAAMRVGGALHARHRAHRRRDRARHDLARSRASASPPASPGCSGGSACRSVGGRLEAPDYSRGTEGPEQSDIASFSSMS